jgi:glycerol-3-phosphate acyltransferase PlsY
MDFSPIFLWMVVAFFLGSIPFGYLFVYWKGKGDIRNFGSGNIGATNVSRAGGTLLGILTLLCDLLKGSLAVLLVKTWAQSDWVFAAMLLSVLGHIYTPWLKFKGGKGVATLCGALLVASPKLLLLGLLVFIGVFLLSRIVSLSSIAAAAALPIFSLYLLRPFGIPFFLILFLSLIIIIKHRSNIDRLIRKEEPTFHL